MRLLIIAPYYYPYINPRAFRWTAIAEEWAASGIEVHVVCSRREDWPDYSRLQGVHIHRVGYNSLKEIFYNYFRPSYRRGEASQPQKSGAPKPGRLNRLLLWLNERLWKPFYWPDDASIWIGPARRKCLELVGRLSFDGIISVSLPFSAHLVALGVHKKYSTLPWVQDVGDPFSLQTLHPLNNNRLYAQKNRRWERYLLRKADQISITNAGLKRAYLQLEPELESRLHIIPPVSGSVPTKPATASLSDNRIHLGYFGSFFKGIREPGPILNYFARLIEAHPELGARLQLHFFGDIFENFLPAFRQYPLLEKVIQRHGLLDREQAFYWMNQMDILFNIGNKSSFQLPSKSADYLASGKPIINFWQIEADTTRAFFEGYPYFLHTPLNGDAEARAAVQTFIRTQAGKQIQAAWLEKRIAPLQPPQIADRYLQLFRPKKKVSAQ